jgi:hypothetical protein
MSETPGVYNVGDSEALLRSPLALPQASADRVLRPQKPVSFESQLEALPPDVRSVADSLALRDMESAKRYVSQYLAANRGVRS